VSSLFYGVGYLHGSTKYLLTKLHGVIGQKFATSTLCRWGSDGN